MSRRLLSMQGDRVLTALWDDGRIIECSVDERVPAFLGRIYLAKVDHIVPSISGAFLSAWVTETLLFTKRKSAACCCLM